MTRLTKTQLRMVELVGEGKRNKQIAEEMGWTVGSAKVYLSKIFAATGATSRTELALRADSILSAHLNFPQPTETRLDGRPFIVPINRVTYTDGSQELFASFLQMRRVGDDLEFVDPKGRVIRRKWSNVAKLSKVDLCFGGPRTEPEVD